MNQGKESPESRWDAFEALIEANHTEDGGIVELSYDIDETAGAGELAE